MMKNLGMKILSMLAMGLVIAGCGKTIDLDQKIYVTSHEMLDDRDEVDLPGGYNVENFRNLSVAVNFKQLSAGGDKKEVKIPAIVKSNLRNSMTKMKRFTIILPDEDSDVEAAESLDTDLKLNVKVQASKARYPYDGHKHKFIFTVTGSASLAERSGSGDGAKSLEGLDISGRAARLTLFRGANRIGGFNEYNKNEVGEVLTVATRRAFKNLFSQLGNLYPIGGKITAVSPSGEFMTLDKGTEAGVGLENHQFTVFVRMDGVDIPLCYADARGGSGKSQLAPWRWSKTADAKILRKEYEASPKQFLKNHKDELFAVGWGLPVPPEWDEDGTNKELDKLLEN